MSVCEGRRGHSQQAGKAGAGAGSRWGLGQTRKWISSTATRSQSCRLPIQASNTNSRANLNFLLPYSPKVVEFLEEQQKADTAAWILHFTST